MRLPELESPEKYGGLYVFDFGEQVAVGYTADEIAVLLESQRYADGKAYRIHRAMPDGTIAVCADGTGNVVWFDHNGRASRVVAPVPVWLRDLTASPDGDLYSCMGTVNRLAAGADEFVPLTVQHEGVARDPLSSIVSPDLQRLFVYDMETERILIMNRNAGYLNRIPNIGRLDGTRMAFTPDGNLAIAGQGLAVPAVFDPDGYLLTGPDENFNKGLFGSTPLPAIISDMAVDASGTIYIVLKSGEVLRFQPRPVTSRTVAR